MDLGLAGEQMKKGQPHQADPFLLVGRTRFELVTNGLKVS